MPARFQGVLDTCSTGLLVDYQNVIRFELDYFWYIPCPTITMFLSSVSCIIIVLSGGVLNLTTFSAFHSFYPVL